MEEETLKETEEQQTQGTEELESNEQAIENQEEPYEEEEPKGGPDPREAYYRLKAEKEAWQREKQLYQQRLNELENMQNAYNQPKNPYEDMSDDDIPSFSHIKDVYNRLESLSNYNRTLENRLKQISTSLSEQKARQKYPDFDEVVTDEFVTRLQLERPAILRAIYEDPDPADAAYRFAKGGSFHLYEEKAKQNGSKEVIDKLMNNRNKQGSLAGKPSGKSTSMTLQQLLDLPDEEYEKIPAEQRMKIFQKAVNK